MGNYRQQNEARMVSGVLGMFNAGNETFMLAIIDRMTEDEMIMVISLIEDRLVRKTMSKKTTGSFWRRVVKFLTLGIYS